MIDSRLIERFQTVKDGAPVDIVFDNIPGRIYHARVIAIPKGIGQGQIAVSGTLAKTSAIGGAPTFPAVLFVPDISAATRFGLECRAVPLHSHPRAGNDRSAGIHSGMDQLLYRVSLKDVVRLGSSLARQPVRGWRRLGCFKTSRGRRVSADFA